MPDTSHADSCFFIGRTHKVCQDYARAGKTPSGLSYAIIADGCSSSPDTDFGARFLTMAAMDGICTQDSHTRLDLNRIVQLARSQVLPPLPLECLDATLLTLTETPEGVRAEIAGDGCVVGLKRDGTVQIWDIDFKGAPGYLSYLLSMARWANYTKQGFGVRTVSLYENGTATTTFQTITLDDFAMTLEFPREEYATVFVITDGAKSFERDTGLGMDPVPFQAVIEQLTAIKGYTGEFLARRGWAFETRFCRDQKWHHNDDLGMAAVHLLETKPEPTEVQP